jgi:hypothetical protein
MAMQGLTCLLRSERFVGAMLTVDIHNVSRPGRLLERGQFALSRQRASKQETEVIDFQPPLST